MYTLCNSWQLNGCFFLFSFNPLEWIINQSVYTFWGHPVYQLTQCGVHTDMGPDCFPAHGLHLELKSPVSGKSKPSGPPFFGGNWWSSHTGIFLWNSCFRNEFTPHQKHGSTKSTAEEKKKWDNSQKKEVTLHQLSMDTAAWKQYLGTYFSLKLQNQFKAIISIHSNTRSLFAGTSLRLSIWEKMLNDRKSPSRPSCWKWNHFSILIRPLQKPQLFWITSQ